MSLRLALLATLLATSLPVPAEPPARPRSSPAKPAVQPPRVLDLDWKQLLPENERKLYSPLPPPPVHDYRGEAGPPAVQVQDFKANKSLDGAVVRLPGFIIPLDARRDGVVSEFLLVPYFGACIHVPPPPPNQLVYVRMARRTTLQSIYDAYWITGKLRLQTTTTHLGAAAYELSAEKIELYQY
jgi:hypothetical protein